MESKEEGPGSEGTKWTGMTQGIVAFAKVDLIYVSWPIIHPVLG